MYSGIELHITTATAITAIDVWSNVDDLRVAGNLCGRCGNSSAGKPVDVFDRNGNVTVGVSVRTARTKVR